MCGKGSLTCHANRDTGHLFLTYLSKYPVTFIYRCRVLSEKNQSLPILKSWSDTVEVQTHGLPHTEKTLYQLGFGTDKFKSEHEI